MYDYDVIFIGSGHSCWHGGIILRHANKKVALVERELLGGTCTNYGCDAKILLDSPIELKEALDRYKGIGLTQEATVDWTSLMKYKKDVIGAMPQAMEGLLGPFGFDILRGEGKFIDEHTIEVAGKQYTAEYFVIGTGQDYVPMDIPGKEYFHNSREFLSLDVIPDHVTFVGAGIISMEFASICLALGKKVDIVTSGDAALRAYQQDYVARIIDKMRAQGANFVWNAHIEAIEKNGDTYTLKGGNGLSIDTDYILIAVGRKANVDGMNLDKIGISYSDKGIVVDDHMRTAVKHIYASGDVVDKKIPKLTPTAEFESNYIAMDILNPANAEIRYPVIPHLVFTLPRIAQVGISKKEALSDPEKYRIEELMFGKSMSWLNKAEKDAHITYVFDNENHLVGAAVYSDDAGSFIDLLTLIINKKIGAEDLSRMIFSFPTTTYGLISMLIPLFMKGGRK